VHAILGAYAQERRYHKLIDLLDPQTLQSDFKHKKHFLISHIPSRVRTGTDCLSIFINQSPIERKFYVKL